VTTGLAAAELVESREILPGQWVQSYHAPGLARGSRAGQFVQVLGRPFPIHTADVATGTVTIHFGADLDDGLARLRPGDRVDLSGPFGRPFEVDPRSRHILLVASGLGIAGVRMLADETIRAGCHVTLLFGASSARAVYPSSLLPDEVEYIVATDDGSLGHHGRVTDLVAGYESWADQAFASGPMPMLARLADLAAGRRDRLGVATLGRKPGAGRVTPAGSPSARRKAFLQVAIEQTVECAAGDCLRCVVTGSSGVPQRVCREGPVFAAEEVDWERGWSRPTAGAE
jgi:dihydroorotate dehydrogenase electron transfer subunit